MVQSQLQFYSTIAIEWMIAGNISCIRIVVVGPTVSVDVPA